MKKTGMKLLALLLTLGLMMGLVACDGKEEASNDPNLGLYEASTAEMWGMELDVSDLYKNGFTLELKAKGKCTINADGTKSDGEWTLDGEKVHLSAGGVEIDGILRDGTISVEDLMGMGISMVFVNAAHQSATPNNTPAETTVQVTEVALTPAQAYWNGDWYGYWLVTNASGDRFEGWDDGTYWYDTCARIQLDENGEGSLILWDEDFTEDEPLCEMDVAISEGGFEQGRLKSVSGYFMDHEVGNADWLIDPESIDGVENMILIEGTYRDPEDWFNSFDFEMVLRPWGLDWSDLTEEDWPYYYEDWYLPMIQAGKSMPGTIGETSGGDTPSTSGDSGNNAQAGFTGPTAVLDFKDAGEIFITYNTDLFTYDADWDQFESADGNRSVSIMWHWDMSSVEGRLDRMANFADAEGYSYEELTIGGHQAYRMTYIDNDFGTQYITETMIVFGEGYKKAAVTMFSYSGTSFEESQCADVEAMLATVTAAQ